MKTELDLKLMYKQETGKDCVTHIPNQTFTDYEQDFEYYEWVQLKLLELLNRVPQSIFDDQMAALKKSPVVTSGPRG